MYDSPLSTEAERLDLTTADGVCDAVFAAPQGGGTYPGVLLYMDALGLRPTIDAWVERIAAQGYAVLAPNLFYRIGRAPVVELPDFGNTERREAYWDRLMPVMRALTPDLMVRDAGSYLQALEGMARTAPGKIGATGYCMGGAMAFRTAAAYPDRIAAIASFHGGNLASEAENSPHLLVGKLQGEAYVGHADHDESAPPEQQVRLEEALAAANVPHRTELYAGAEHGYTMADIPAYDHAAAERHFERLIDLLDRTLKG